MEMPTIKQERAVAIMAENGGIVSKAMLEAGYSPETAVTPHKLTQSVGYREIMRKNGITEDFVSLSLKADIDAKPADRLGELNLASKILGMHKDIESEVNNMVVVLPNSLHHKLSNTSSDMLSNKEEDTLIDN